MEPVSDPDVDDVDGVGDQELVHVVGGQLNKILQFRALELQWRVYNPIVSRAQNGK